MLRRLVHALHDALGLRSWPAKSRIRQIKSGTVYPATMGMLPVFLGKIVHEFPDVCIHIASGNTSDIIRGLEPGQINLGFIRPVGNIGSGRRF